MTAQIENMLGSISSESIQHYLSHSGWQKIGYKTDDVMKYVLKEDSSVSILVPKFKKNDYSKSVGLIVKTLSDLEDRDYFTVLKNIVIPYTDAINFRFISNSSNKGSLPLKYLQESVANIRQALIFSACAELNAKPSYNRPTKKAIEIIDKSRFGQTQLGPYIISIDVPHEMPLAHFDNKKVEYDPIERRIIKRIIMGLSEARDIGISGKNFNEESYRTGLNANLAEALYALNDQDTNIEISAHWDKSTLISENVPTTPIMIEERIFDTLRSIGTKLRKEIVYQNVILKGYVCGLNREEDDDNDDESEGTIHLKITDSGDASSTKTAKVVLTAEDYAKACDYHRDKILITIRGRLEKPGGKGSWVLSNYSNFTKAL